MALTITAERFKALTNRERTWRTSNQKNVIAKLEAFQKTPTNVALVALRGALRTWKSKHPKEFAGCDEASVTRLTKELAEPPKQGICTQLMLEVGLYPNNVNKEEPDLFAYKISLQDSKLETYQKRKPMQDSSKCGAVFECLNKSVAKALEEAHPNAAVVLIDMEGPEGELRADAAASHGFHTRFDEVSVLEHQVEVLTRANELGVPVFDVTTTAPNAATMKQLTAVFNGLKTISFKKTANNPFDTKGGAASADGKQSLRGALEAASGEGGKPMVVVMGYHANQCVNSTIFGNAGIEGVVARRDGLLDLGYTVITSRNVVASDANAPLQIEYGPMAT